MADSHIRLNANRIQIEAGRSDSKEKSRGQNVGAEVGMFAQVGAQYGVGVYANVGGGSNKADGHSTTYHNSHLDSETVTLNSQGDTTLRGAQAKGKTVNVNTGGDLKIESLQDEAEFESKGNQVGVHAEISFGTAWNVSGNASAERGTTSRKQVAEQAGIFAEEGGYHVNADNVHLKGAVIASTNAQSSELATNKFSFEDIENYSKSKAVSASISGGYSHQNERYEEKGTGKIIDNTDPGLTRGADGKINNPAVKTIAESNSPSLSPGMPMYEASHDHSTTKAVLTEGNITLNKDSQPQQTSAAELGIQTSLENANKQVANTKDVQKQLAEQKEIREAINNVQSAVNTYTANQATEAARTVEKLEAELAQAKNQGDSQKISEKTTALLSAQANAEAWQIGGSKKRTVDTVTAIITTALAGKTGAEIAVAASSPSINEFIHEKTKDNKAANLLAHAALSAAEFYAAGQDPLTGALAGAAGEGTAMLLAEKVFNKKPAELSAEEKETLRIASMLAGGLVGAVGNTSHNNHGANGLASATEGMATAQRAVENNYLHSGEVESLIRELAKAEKEGRDTKPIFEKYARLSEKNRQEILQECGDNPACYMPHMYMMNSGDEAAYENFSGLRFTTYFNGLSAETRAAMHDFVTNENAITRDALPWTIHAGMAALEFGEAIGAGAAIVNGKNLISSGKRPQVEGNARSQANTKENTGRTSKASPSLTSENVPNKPHYTVGKNGKIDYSSSGFDYERRLVGDSDYDMPKKQTETATANPMDSKPKSSGAENAALYPNSYSPNASVALSKKLSALQNAIDNSVKQRVLTDGRIRYYEKERLAKNPGPTRGNSFVTEYDPRTGRIKQWMESYDHEGNINRVHPKSINGQQIDSLHYPPTLKEIKGLKND